MTLRTLSSDFDLVELDHMTVRGVSQEISHKQLYASLRLFASPTYQTIAVSKPLDINFHCKQKPVMQKRYCVLPNISISQSVYMYCFG